ncbi:HAD-IC family P-type ATPase [Nesterenkonia lutea]|uniref:Magnesium-transporting ATPase (P-type) n=1 Tax=Nesterenkonia lutea TaxID=272919 RepID=A0ABR9JG92_9MICC|nr:HAD-IC family P-type ATPase [Nesterenkonia lutea]MBE1524958.1 magnesium-transporting ATPase (P-type) [Nesterenkonia lutea]
MSSPAQTPSALDPSAASSAASDAAAVDVATAYALEHQEVLRRLKVEPEQGLSTEAAATNLEHHGPNRLAEPDKDNAFIRFIAHFNDVLIYVLLGAGVLTAVLQHWADTIVILLVVLINALVGFLQEGRAERALEGIRKMLSPSADVRREGSWTTVDAELVVPGDIVRLRTGDKVPADVRLTDTADLAIEESALTGESVPAEKTTDPSEEGAPLGDRTSMAFSGTMLTSGTATGVVVGTGDDTEIGRINTMMSEVETLETPLTQQIARFGKALSLGVLVLTLLLVGLGWFVHGTPITELLQAAAGFAVAAIPEGLPALITITLALGVQTMAKRNAITRKLSAVQTLGSVTTICSDKTGTLTKNEMTAERVILADATLEVSGTGYIPEGTVTQDGRHLTLEHSGLRRFVEIMSLTNDTELIRNEAGGWGIAGEPTEGALKSLAGKLDFDDAASTRLTTLPFSSQNKLMATTAELPEGETLVLVKGAPDRLLARSSTQLTSAGQIEALDAAAWNEHIDALSADGLRVLGAAFRPAHAQDGESLAVEQLGEELTFAGVVGIVDPPRQEAIDAIKICHDAGIQVKMITGDHAGTATAIARHMGLDNGEGAISGPQLEATDDEALRELAQRHHVFARTSPEHKLRLVRALQAEGEVVAMTGDGVNDAPALRRADVGVAMGLKGTEVTKDAAEVVLADDNFTSIETAVEEGRRIYDNLRKALVFLLPTNGAQATVVLFAVAFGWTLPLTPLQVLWVNMVTAVTLAFAFAFEPAEEGIMRRRPRDPKAAIVESRHVVQIVVVSLLIAAVTIIVFRWRIDVGDDLEGARTLATTVLVVCQVFYLFSVKSLERFSLRPSVVFKNKVAWLMVAVLTLLQVGFVYLPWMHTIFDTAVLDPFYLLITLSSGVLVLVLTELLKLALYAGRVPNPRAESSS